MRHFENWETLSKLLADGFLKFIDLAFATSVLRKLNSVNEEHAALLAVLFALSRQGHLMLDVEALAIALKPLQLQDNNKLIQLITEGVQTFPADGIDREPKHRPHAWICCKGTYFYLQKNWVYESEILTHVHRLSTNPITIPLSCSVLDSTLNDAQKKAVENGMLHSLSLLTGGPGTGKTFTAAELVKTCLNALSEDRKVILTAPTGKAVAQLEGSLRKAIGNDVPIVTGTLHAILHLRSESHEEEIQPLLADLIVVDECSMIDAKIFSRLLASVASGTRLVLIGDKDQLPPVEAGSIFADLIDAGAIPSTHLRQTLRSDRVEILSLAKYIREGRAEEAIEFLAQNDAVQWIDLDEEKKSPSELYSHLWNLSKDRFPSSFSEKPAPEQLLNKLGSFAILSCMRQGPLGVDAINAYFVQQCLNAAQGPAWWAAPLMITKNDHDLQLFNGDLGVIVRKMTPDFSLKVFSTEDFVLFHDRKGGYRQMSALALNAFEYSYCLSVHKSQGSEYDEILILSPKGSESFGREVLYTAVTRARHKITLAASKELLLKSIAISSRKTSGIMARI